MSREIDQREPRDDDGRTLRAVERGASFVITRDGAPAARLLPFEGDRALVSRDELKRTSADLPHVDFDRLRCDTEDLVDQDLRDPFTVHGEAGPQRVLPFVGMFSSGHGDISTRL
ncbi:antitoxin (DNA-binding transcriptional repressor) of toxin-antitoxin stability system [Spinactinospora alkalitolerans]|uniref:Antitoxin (DNA-binding transcriptional repressor) of toxin-antitoxin stability system n=1 Tax=Spinactinospora alkalitolerans TaxID=687207 RepID=A0A852U0M0_9ACTN|nr:prevent-host-death protein [Spinactinospora alkalitolerans]NYE49651.1 antitoxin (DNA-binding transcriptional repressor) of toxin-antitoxin stability system [Spinactinospora alkalitolerans]